MIHRVLVMVAILVVGWLLPMTAMAVSFNPLLNDVLATEEGRTTTIGGADMSGHELVVGNSDIEVAVLTLAPNKSALIASVTGPDDGLGNDTYVFPSLEEPLVVSILLEPVGSGSASIEFRWFVNGSEAGSVILAAAAGGQTSFSTPVVVFANAALALELSRFSSNDALVDIAVGPPSTIPVPAALPLLASAIIGLGLLARHRRA